MNLRRLMGVNDGQQTMENAVGNAFNKMERKLFGNESEYRWLVGSLHAYACTIFDGQFDQVLIDKD